MTEFIVIPLKDRIPIKIRQDDWPVVSIARVYGEGEEECVIEIMQHRDGRCIVYGSYTDQSGNAEFAGTMPYYSGAIVDALEVAAESLYPHKRQVISKACREALKNILPEFID